MAYDVAGPHIAAAQSGGPVIDARHRSIVSVAVLAGMASQKAALISRVRWLPVVESGSSIRSMTVNALQSLRASTIASAGKGRKQTHGQAPGRIPFTSRR